MNGVNGNIVGVDPLLAPLGDYGGPTQTMALLPGSPAINQGGAVAALAAAGVANTASTDVTLASGSALAATNLPALTSGDYFVIHVDSELMAVTALTLNADGTATLMVVHGADGTTAATHAGGAQVLLASDQRGELIAPGGPDIGAFQSQGFTTHARRRQHPAVGLRRRRLRQPAGRHGDGEQPGRAGQWRHRHLRRALQRRLGHSLGRHGDDRRQSGQRHGHGRHDRRHLHRDRLRAGVTTPASFALTNTPGARRRWRWSPARARRRRSAPGFASPLVVVVKDAYGNPVPGVSVTFAAPASAPPPP